MPGCGEAAAGIPTLPAVAPPTRGVPSLSTPSLAADMSAEPRLEASNRAGRVPVASEAPPVPPRLLKPKPWDTEEVAGAVVDDDVGGCSCATSGLLCCRLEAWRSEVLWI